MRVLRGSAPLPREGLAVRFLLLNVLPKYVHVAVLIFIITLWQRAYGFYFLLFLMDISNTAKVGK